MLTSKKNPFLVLSLVASNSQSTAGIKDLYCRRQRSVIPKNVPLAVVDVQDHHRGRPRPQQHTTRHRSTHLRPQ